MLGSYILESFVRGEVVEVKVYIEDCSFLAQDQYLNCGQQWS